MNFPPPTAVTWQRRETKSKAQLRGNQTISTQTNSTYTKAKRLAHSKRRLLLNLAATFNTND